MKTQRVQPNYRENEGLGWITSAIYAAGSIESSAINSNAQKKAHKSMEKQMQIQTEAQRKLARIAVKLQ